MNIAFEREALGEPAVYPGHAVTLALLITHAFPSLEAAAATGKQFPRALESNNIPGAGGNVYVALDLLRRLRAGEVWEDAMWFADEAWSNCDSQLERNTKRWVEGQAQADRCKLLLAARASWWTPG